LLSQTLGQYHRVDFPTVTEICERLACNASDLAAVVQLLTSVLQEEQTDISRQLKALTVAHELLYDDAARQALVSTPGFMEALSRPYMGADIVKGRETHGLAAESSALLAEEIRRRLSLESMPTSPSKNGSSWSRNPVRAALAALSLAPGQGKTAAAAVPTLCRQVIDKDAAWSECRCSIEAIVAEVRKYRRAPRVVDASSVLDDVFRCFERATSCLTRAPRQREACHNGAKAACQDDVAELTNTILLAADNVQNSVVEWKCKLLEMPANLNDEKNEPSGVPQWSTYVAFLDEALTVGDSLITCVSVFQLRQQERSAGARVSEEKHGTEF